MPVVKFDGSTVVFDKLKKYGFNETDGMFKYSAEIADGQFVLSVTVDGGGKIFTELIDKDTNDEYVLHFTESEGAYVGKIRNEYESVLNDIKSKCCEPIAFREEHVKAVLSYIKKQYGGSLEFLWEKSPDSAVIRNKETKKWYALFMYVSKRKLGFDSDETVCILDLHIKKEDSPKTVDGKTVFPGYHMNKRTWITVCLDGSVPLDKIYRLVDNSYDLAKK